MCGGVKNMVDAGGLLCSGLIWRLSTGSSPHKVCSVTQWPVVQLHFGYGGVDEGAASSQHSD